MLIGPAVNPTLMAEIDILTETKPVAEPPAPKVRKGEARLLEVSDAMNTTLDLETLLTRVAEVVRKANIKAN